MCVNPSVTSYTLWLQDYSPPKSSVHGILQARMLDWVASLSSRGSSWPRNPTWVACIAVKFLGFEIISSLDTFQIKLLLTSKCNSLHGLTLLFLLGKLNCKWNTWQVYVKKKKNCQNFFYIFLQRTYLQIKYLEKQ